nr:hypothetical protein [Tanacetum cinerariifolium]
EYNKAAWHLTNQRRLFDETLAFWLSDVNNELERFDALFLNKEVYLDAIDVSKTGFNHTASTEPEDRNITNAIAVASIIFNSDSRLIKDCRLNFTWKKLLDFSYPI